MKTILIAAISADGKIAEQIDQNSTDWTSKEDLKFFVKKTKELGAVIMGRKTFETIGKALKGRRTIVLTRNPKALPTLPEGGRGGEGAQTSLEYTDKTPKAILTDLEESGQKGVVIAGGASIYTMFLKEGLVDELYLTVEPVIFGDKGIPLVRDVGRINLELIEKSDMGDQAVLLHYRVKR